MKSIKKRLAVAMALVMVLTSALALTSCGGEDEATLNIVQQPGMAYAPLKIMEEKGLVEKNYDGEITAQYSELSNGATITESFLSGDVDVGCMGVSPAIIAVNAGVPIKICCNLSGQPNELLTNDDSVNSLKDIDKQSISLVSPTSIQYYLLAMRCKEELGDVHALDDNMVQMAHPDGLTALMSGEVDCQYTSAPYTYQGLEDEKVHQVGETSDVWPDGNSFIVCVATQTLYDENPDLYNAVVAAFREAIDFINDNPREAAEILAVSEDTEPETILEWLDDPACVYSTECRGVMDMSNFMGENGLLENDAPESFSDLAYDNVKGN